MIYDKFKKLIDFLASCNGTSEAELQARIKSGEVSQSDAAHIRMIVAAKKVNARLTDVSDKLDTML